MAIQSEVNGRLHATAAEVQTLTDLIERFPAEAQLIMAALEEGLTLGPMQPMDAV
jgi:hypothetical protein